MSISIKRLERAIGDLPKGGMQTGNHKVKLDLADAERLIAELNALQAERDALRQVCAGAYQMAGAIDAPNEALDNLSAAANGDPIPHKTFLPIFGDHLSAHDAEVAKAGFDACSEKIKEVFGWIVPDDWADQYAAKLRAKVG